MGSVRLSTPDSQWRLKGPILRAEPRMLPPAPSALSWSAVGAAALEGPRDHAAADLMAGKPKDGSAP